MLHRVPFGGRGGDGGNGSQNGAPEPTERTKKKLFLAFFDTFVSSVSFLNPLPPSRASRPRAPANRVFKIKLTVQGARTATLRAAAYAGGRPIRKSNHGSKIYASIPSIPCLAADRRARDDARGRRAGPGVRAAGCTGRANRPCSGCPRSGRARPADQAAPRALQGAGRHGSDAVGRPRRSSSTRPTSTSIATAASGWPRASATAPITPVSPKATASSCCRTPTATARPTAPTPSCRSRLWSRRSACRSSTTRLSSRSRQTSSFIPTSIAT